MIGWADTVNASRFFFASPSAFARSVAFLEPKIWRGTPTTTIHGVEILVTWWKTFSTWVQLTHFYSRLWWHQKPSSQSPAQRLVEPHSSANLRDRFSQLHEPRWIIQYYVIILIWHNSAQYHNGSKVSSKNILNCNILHALHLLLAFHPQGSTLPCHCGKSDFRARSR